MLDLGRVFYGSLFRDPRDLMKALASDQLNKRAYVINVIDDEIHCLDFTKRDFTTPTLDFAARNCTKTAPYRTPPYQDWTRRY